MTGRAVYDRAVMTTQTNDDLTLMDVLIDGFEKNESLGGTYWRQIPMTDEGAAARKFQALVGEMARWKGEPTSVVETGKRRIARWDGIDIRQTGIAILVRV